MKKIIYFLLIFAIFSLFSSICYAQWVAQTNPSSNNLLDVSFINRNTGWACGDGGVIIKTTNAGTNWELQNSGVTDKNLFGIHAIDSQYVYCVGWFETILKTTNGGTNWIIIRNGPWGQGASFFGLYFLNRNIGWMLKNFYILRTTDGCNTFDSTLSIFSYLRDIYFKDDLTGILCGDGSLIMKSTDGGVVWNQITIPQTTTESPDFFKESFVGNTGWVVGRGTNTPGLGPNVWTTTNFGTNWDTIGRVPYPYEAENYCVYFSGLSTGWCGGSYGYLFKTPNGGFNWYQQVVPSNYFRRSMWFYNDSIGWAVGGAGQILYTTTSGQYVGVEKISGEIPKDFHLYQNYPNPFNPSTKIKFDIPNFPLMKGARGMSVRLTIYDILGREIATLVNQQLNPGMYEVEWDASNYPSGVYFYKINTESFNQTKRMVLIK
ncbi:MAG: YCF48-related protein [Ignavibacteria bacterium]|jgi:photosystem II stability/assembly factor-like uncharacterized protein